MWNCQKYVFVASNLWTKYLCVGLGSGVWGAVVSIQQQRFSEQLYRLGRQSLAQGQLTRGFLTYITAG